MRRMGLALGVCLALASGCRRAPAAGASAKVGNVTVRRAVAWTMAEIRSATIGFELDLAQGADTLVGVSSPAGRAGLHGTRGAGGMHALSSLPVGPGRTMIDGTTVHVMVEELAADIPVGGTLPLELRFAQAGSVRLDVPVLRFSEALMALGR
jgi:copper(I)-binding protein